MNDTLRDTEIDFNEELISKVVYAITKAIREDVPQYRQEHHLETNNAAKYIAADYINENLRHYVATDNVTLHHFRRFVWDGCLLIDYARKITYTILTASTYASAPKKHGPRPYYLQSLLCTENKNCEGTLKQMTLDGYYTSQGSRPFSNEEFELDFQDIMQGEIQIDDDYRHYVIVYRAERSEITDFRLVYLDRDFAEVDSKDLMEYVVPDFAHLTTMYPDEDDQNGEPQQSTVELKLRAGVKPFVRAEEEEV